MAIDLDVDVTRGAFALRIATRLAEPSTGITGPSGSGKTTLLHLIAGLVRPTRGRIAIDGDVLDDTARRIHVPPHRRRIGLVFQHGRLLPHLTVEGNLRYGERLLAAGARRIAFRDVVDLLDIAPLVARRIAGLSGGERQRVALGRALLASPRLLLLDEPLASLDQRLKEQVLPGLERVFRELRMPFLYVSHDVAETRALTGDVVAIEHGAMVARSDAPPAPSAG
ncbi:MAG TPA: ATP-binding cassette domain-containing protein [Planctomycetota bacterium]|nr:ATP-binding cassette domain-containing protein [Planctomycetota bacterium]